jgi:hypothetical protein
MSSDFSTRIGFLAAVALAAVSIAYPAAAQTPAASPASPAGHMFIGATGGAAAVENVSGTFGGEIGVTLTDLVDVFGEGAWMADVVSRRELDDAKTIATFLQNSQGAASTGTVKAPAFYAGAAVRVMFMHSGTVHPYVTAGGGIAHIAYQPTFTLGGTDVTANLSQYGVTLGSDVTGEVTKPAFSGGFGVHVTQGRWYVDGSLRVTSIRTDQQATNVVRVIGGVGYTF